MQRLIVIFSLTFCLTAEAQTYKEAEAAMEALAHMKDQRSVEFITAQGKAVNDVWQLTGPCFKLGVEDRTSLIISVSENGRVNNVWANKVHAKAECLKAIVSSGQFPTPPYYPYYLKVIM